ncbi:NAD-dependent epimerase/dehydratase family protein [Amycolatopsis sp. FDAARGOS 1241]|uniref:NAD-dependent epimerase/dehydratase family protein n=1 Tax=Amycolatopsis sp. FDAARGOS 1241 TaxID=2778070 RepID=UPI0019523017|nr:NAD-dependent epimerase/dehydratase family protein [Amycolatopsis sp. FDAARGOS 1241]QRP47161.1 NAD-dependent epimerase/dehydratase family protein [Amycolatopsis sp. FDAARGOS 1241]
MPGTVLVTGGTGYVGGWCTAELLRRGHTVRTSVRSAAKEAAVRRAVASEIDPGDRLEVVVADLTANAGWAGAVAGCTHLLHVASPLGGDGSCDPGAFIAPARDGVLRVLKAATDAGVERVVLTSSCAAAAPPIGTRSREVYDERLLTDVSDRRLGLYRRSKAVAEHAAWDFMAEHGGSTTPTTILPGAVLGPVLAGQALGPVQLVGTLLAGRAPGVPRLGYGVSDIRDLAHLHVRGARARSRRRAVHRGRRIPLAARRRARDPRDARPDGEPGGHAWIAGFVLRALALVNPACARWRPTSGARPCTRRRKHFGCSGGSRGPPRRPWPTAPGALSLSTEDG